MSEYRPTVAIHPGRTLQNHLSYLGVTQKWLAERTGLTEKHISEILNQNSPITAHTAVKLANVLGGSAEFWTNLDANYRTKIARIDQEERATKEVALLKNIPYTEMANLGWVEKVQNKTERVINLYSYFGINSLTNIQTSQPAAFRMSSKKDANQLALAAWLRRGEILASTVENVADYDEKGLKRSLVIIKEVAYDMPKDFFNQIREILAECGVILVATEYLAKTYVNGATRWIGHHPLIELSDRGKRDDIVWFTLFHEIGHILKHGKKAQFVDSDQTEASELEQEADLFASEAWLPGGIYDAFVKDHPSPTKADICALAMREHVPPSIICGRLKKDGVIEYNRFKDLHTMLTVQM